MRYPVVNLSARGGLGDPSPQAGLPGSECEGLGLLAKYQCEIDRLKRELRHPTTSQPGRTPVMPPPKPSEPTTYSGPSPSPDENAANSLPVQPLYPVVEPSPYGYPVARTGPPIMPPPPPPLLYPLVEPSSYGYPVARTGPPIMPPPAPPPPPSSSPSSIEPSGYPVAPPPPIWCPDGQHFDWPSRSCVPDDISQVPPLPLESGGYYGGGGGRSLIPFPGSLLSGRGLTASLFGLGAPHFSRPIRLRGR